MGLNLCDRCAADCRHERNPNEIVVKCGAFKPPATNADRIRAMTDEELDMFLRNVKNRARIISLGNKLELLKELVNMDWLQQPAEGDEDV